MVKIATPFGLFLKSLRAKHEETAEEMARKLKISRGYLFAVEAGKRSIPPSWPQSLYSLYGLTREDMRTMRQAILDSMDTIELDISHLPKPKRTLAISFSRQLRSLDDPTTSEIQQILDKSKNSEQS